MNHIDYIQITTTVDDQAIATRMAESLVAKRLAACAQVLGPITSIYRWQDRIEKTVEWMCIIKTTSRNFAALTRELSSLHPYDTPEIIASPITDGSSRYLAWLDENTSS